MPVPARGPVPVAGGVEPLRDSLNQSAARFARLMPMIIAAAGKDPARLAIAGDAADRAVVAITAPRRAEMVDAVIAEMGAVPAVRVPFKQMVELKDSAGGTSKFDSAIVRFPEVAQNPGLRPERITYCTLEMGKFEIGLSRQGTITTYGEAIDDGPVKVYRTRPMPPQRDISTGMGLLDVAGMIETVSVSSGILNPLKK